FQSRSTHLWHSSRLFVRHFSPVAPIVTIGINLPASAVVTVAALMGIPFPNAAGDAARVRQFLTSLCTLVQGDSNAFAHVFVHDPAISYQNSVKTKRAGSRF